LVNFDAKGGTKIEAQPEAMNMLTIFERILQEQQTMTELGVAVNCLI
jgi:hypothetical protein